MIIILRFLNDFSLQTFVLREFLKRFKKKSYHTYIYKYLKHCSSCYSNEKVITNVVDSFIRGVKPWDQKKKGSLDGTGYKREDARCGREGTRGPSKQIRRTSRFLLDLLLDLSIYLSIYLASILAGLSDRDHRTRGSTSFPLPSSLSLFPPPLFSFPLGGRKHGTRKCAHGADT